MSLLDIAPIVEVGGIWLREYSLSFLLALGVTIRCLLALYH